MIAITNDAGDTLHLTPGQSVVTEQAIAWLSDDELPGEFSYPISCPLDEHNQRFVSYGYRPDSARPQRSIPVTVKMDGVLYRRCQFSFRAQGGKLTGSLKIDSAEAYDKLRKLSLLEALPDPVRLGTGLLDAVNGQAAPSLSARMEQIARMAPGEFPCTFFPLRNEGFFEADLADKLPGFVKQPYVNAWGLLATGGMGFFTDSIVSGYPVVPFFYLSWVLGRIMNLAGFRIESDWLAQDEVQRLVIVNMTAIQVKFTGPSLFKPLLALNGHVVTAGMHLPDMSVSDFLKAIKGRFGLAITFNANTRVCRITQFVDAIQRPPAVDLTPYQSGDYDTSTEADGRGFAVVDFLDAGDALNKTEKGDLLQPVPLTVGAGGQPVTLKAGSTQWVYETSPTPTLLPTVPPWAGRWLVPTVSQAGNCLDPIYKISDRYLDEKGNRRNDIGLKLLSYRGFTHNSGGKPYPLGTPDVRDGGQVVVGKQASSLAGRFGIWRQGLRAYYLFRDQTQTVSQPMWLPVGLLSSLRLDEPVSLTLADSIRRSYLISRIQAEAPGQDGKVKVRLDVLTIPASVGQSADVDEVMVWVEWIEGPIVLTGDPFTVHTNTRAYSVKFWLDKAKTQPALMSSLTINVRQKRQTIYSRISGDPKFTRYVRDETTRTYVVSGQTAVLESSYVVDRLIAVADLNGGTPDGLVQALTLDPGEGYTIL